MPIPYYNIHSHRIPSDALEIAIVNQENDIILKTQANNVYWSAGIHPWFSETDKIEKSWKLICQSVEAKKIIAVGECGLDRLRGPDIQTQEKIFLQHIELSIQSDLPLIIHCVKAYDLLLKFRKEFAKTPCWIVHGFNGKEGLAHQLIEKDIKLSIGAALFQKKNQGLRNLLQKTDLSHLFFETDNSQLSVSDIYRLAADVRCMELEEVALQIQVNFKKCFRKK
ncbi:MAG: TatD family hydrolase [Cyclobacteriaceae bacterium]|nr:TatD family hydrolase [Cyclobacteriaceae bacterium]